MPPYGFDGSNGQWGGQQPPFGQVMYPNTFPTAYTGQPQQTSQSASNQPQQCYAYWVEGDAMPLTYRLRPGEQAFFFDITRPLVYMRRADKDGKPFPMETKLLTDPPVEQPVQQPEIDLSQYVKISDVKGIINQAVEDEVNRRMSEISFKPATTSRKKVDES